MKEQSLKINKKITNNDNLGDDDEPSIKKIKMRSEIQLKTEIITDDQNKLLKKDITIRRNLQAPKFRLKSFGEEATIAKDPAKRKPLLFEDIQSLLMRAILKHCSPSKPERWCVLEKPGKIDHTVVIVIDGPTCHDFSSNENLFVKINNIFEQKFELILSNHRVLQELILIPWMQLNKVTLVKQYGSLDAAFMHYKNPSSTMDKLFSVNQEIEEESIINENANSSNFDKFPRTHLLLSPLQMLTEGYPIPLKNDDRYQNYRPTKSSYKPVTPNSKMFGVDCEMVHSIRADNELARVSIVNENCESVYETLVRPECKIVNYLTQWSGITKEIMMTATKTLEEVREEICNLLPSDAILVGHSLNCDLNAMKLMHPYVIDTSIIYNLTGVRSRKSKLQTLAKHFLNQDIQFDENGHSSIEDSRACLELTKLKLSKSICFGDVVLESKKQCSKVNILDKTAEISPIKKPQKKFQSVLVTCKNSNIIVKNSMINSNGIEYKSELSAKQVIKTVRKIASSSDFVISYINIMDEIASNGLEKDICNNEENYVSYIDKWIYKIWGKMPTNGLLVVIFGGRKENDSNGLAMVKIKN